MGNKIAVYLRTPAPLVRPGRPAVADSHDRCPTAEHQLTLCERWAAERGFTVAEVFEDRKNSAFDAAGRPGFERLLTAIEGGRVSAVVAWKTDRLARNWQDAARLNAALRGCGGFVVGIVDGIDTRARFGERIFEAVVTIRYCAAARWVTPPWEPRKRAKQVKWQASLFTTRPGSAGVDEQETPEFLLAGIGYCGECYGELRPTLRGPNGQPAYTCAGSGNRGCGLAAEVASVDDAIRDQLAESVGAGLLAERVKVIEHGDDVKERRLLASLRKAEAALDETEAEARALGGMSANRSDERVDQRTPLTDRRDGALEGLAALARRRRLSLASAPTDLLRSRWEKMDMNRRRNAVLALANGVMVRAPEPVRSGARRMHNVVIIWRS
ncbi:MAG: recombinase family protein [Chloroflexi bacterium]|nr:recombinase family protein [Chloroflexota bacterium]